MLMVLLRERGVPVAPMLPTVPGMVRISVVVVAFEELWRASCQHYMPAMEIFHTHFEADTLAMAVALALDDELEEVALWPWTTKGPK